MVIPMDSSSTTQAPKGPMTRARARAIQDEVTSLLLDSPLDTHGTWMLPQTETLCMLRYHEEGLGDARGEGQVPMETCTERGRQERQKEARTPSRPRASGPWRLHQHSGPAAEATRAGHPAPSRTSGTS